jgi:hypothetical protein
MVPLADNVRQFFRRELSAGEQMLKRCDQIVE